MTLLSTVIEPSRGVIGLVTLTWTGAASGITKVTELPGQLAPPTVNSTGSQPKCRTGRRAGTVSSVTVHVVKAGSGPARKALAVGERERRWPRRVQYVEAERGARRIAALLAGADHDLGHVERSGELLDRVGRGDRHGVDDDVTTNLLGRIEGRPAARPTTDRWRWAARQSGVLRHGAHRVEQERTDGGRRTGQQRSPCRRSPGRCRRRSCSRS